MDRRQLGQRYSLGDVDAYFAVVDHRGESRQLIGVAADEDADGAHAALVVGGCGDCGHRVHDDAARADQADQGDNVLGGDGCEVEQDVDRLAHRGGHFGARVVDDL